MIHVPLHKQTSGRCGPYADLMTLGYYDVKPPIRELCRYMWGTYTRGCDPEDFVRANSFYRVSTLFQEQEFGKEEHPRIAIQRLEHLVEGEHKPVIVDWMAPINGDRLDHYVVICQVGKKEIVYADPYYGKYKKTDRLDFLHNWYGFRKNLFSHHDLMIRPMLWVDW